MTVLETGSHHVPQTDLYLLCILGCPGAHDFPCPSSLMLVPHLAWTENF